MAAANYRVLQNSRTVGQVLVITASNIDKKFQNSFTGTGTLLNKCVIYTVGHKKVATFILRLLWKMWTDFNSFTYGFVDKLWNAVK